jgi:hypothetical protein
MAWKSRASVERKKEAKRSKIDISKQHKQNGKKRKFVSGALMKVNPLGGIQLSGG